MSDTPHTVLHFPPKLRVINGGGERPSVDANDVILADIEVLVAKSEALIGIQRTIDTLPDRLMLVMAARSLGRSGKS